MGTPIYRTCSELLVCFLVKKRQKQDYYLFIAIRSALVLSVFACFRTVRLFAA